MEYGWPGVFGDHQGLLNYQPVAAEGWETLGAFYYALIFHERLPFSISRMSYGPLVLSLS